jgi:hypothetical protein
VHNGFRNTTHRIDAPPDVALGRVEDAGGTAPQLTESAPVAIGLEPCGPGSAPAASA